MNRVMLVLLPFLLVSFFCINPVSAEMTSTSYQILWDTMGAGGSDDSSSASYGLRDTIGGTAIGIQTSTNYELSAGYRGGVFDQLLDFSLHPQTATATTATAFTSKTVTVGSTASFSVGDYIVLVENEGASQVCGIGKITSVAGSDLIVDTMANNGTAPSIDGSNDYVYLLDGSTAYLASIGTTEVTTSVIAWEVFADSPSGYTVQARADGNLVSGSDDIDAVSDGTVSAGSEEYGARSSDATIPSSTFDTQDTAFTTSPQQVDSFPGRAYYMRQFLIFKASADSTTFNGTYSQTLEFIVTGNY